MSRVLLRLLRDRCPISAGLRGDCRGSRSVLPVERTVVVVSRGGARRGRNEPLLSCLSFSAKSRTQSSSRSQAHNPIEEQHDNGASPLLPHRPQRAPPGHAQRPTCTERSQFFSDTPLSKNYSPLAQSPSTRKASINLFTSRSFAWS